MAINVHIHNHTDNKVLLELLKAINNQSELILSINSKISKLMSNTDQALQDLAGIGQTLTKISGETTTLLQKITDLENAANNSDTPQSVLDAIAAVKSQANTIDGLVPDAPPTEPQA